MIRIGIMAGNYEQAERYAQDNGLGRRAGVNTEFRQTAGTTDVFYVGSAMGLVGVIDPFIVIRVGTWKLRDDLEEILAVARGRQVIWVDGQDPEPGLTEPRCPYCGGRVSLAPSTKVYGKDFGPLWLCNQYPKCDAYVSAERNPPFAPRGTLANRELRAGRREVVGLIRSLPDGEVDIVFSKLPEALQGKRVATYTLEDCKIFLRTVNWREAAANTDIAAEATRKVVL